MMTKSASSTSAALMVADESSDLTESQIFAALPNPVFVLDLENRFIYLNQAAE
ncbi:MAG: PAS domain-containing protein, partial [Candidatus Puniceispirillaceae bacterium]